MLEAILGVGFFYLVIFLVGLYASRNRTADSVSEVLVAGRRIPLWVGILTMTATWVDGGYLNGTAEAVYGRGLVWAQAPWGFALSLILGGLFFARVMHANGFHTMLDPFQQRYGDRLGAIMYFPAMMGELLWTSGILAALGTTFGVLMHLDVRLAILISAGTTLAYTVRGGLWSIAYTDVAQLIMACAGMFLCVPFVFSHFASFDEIWTLYQSKYGASAHLFPSGAENTWTWWDSMLLLVFGGIPWHCYFQRVLSSPTPHIARRLSVIAAGLCILMAIPPALLGMAGAVFAWREHGLEPPAGDFLILPTVLRDLTPHWVGLAGLCAVAGAIMSSVDASIYSASSMWTWNIVHKLFRPEMSPDEVGRTNRKTIVVLGLVAISIALSVKSIYVLWFLSADLVYVILFPQLINVLFVRRISRWGVLAGFLTGLFLRLGGGEATLGLPALLPYPEWLPYKTMAMLAGWAVTLVVSRLPLPGGETNPVPWLDGNPEAES